MKKYVSLLAIMSVVGFSATAFAETNAGQENTCDVNFLGSDESATFVADFDPITYDIHYTGLENATDPNNPTQYDIEDEVVLAAPTKTGYTFTGWNVSVDPTAWGTGSSTSGANPFTIKPGTYGDITFSAGWNANSGIVYKVCKYTKNLGGTNSYSLNGGACASKNGTADASITLANEATGITGFTYDAGFAATSLMSSPYQKPSSGAVTTTTILADGSLVVNLFYDRNTYNLALTAGTGVSAASLSGARAYEYEAPVSISGSCNNGYNNLVWKIGSTTVTPVSTMPANALAYTAECSLVTYTITYNLNKGTGSSTPAHTGTTPANYNVTSNDFTVSDPTRIGYDFVGWTVSVASGGALASGSSSTTGNVKNFKVAKGSYGNITLTAQWTPKKPSLEYVDGITDDVISTDECTYDQKFNLPATPQKAGYTFVGWRLEED